MTPAAGSSDVHRYTFVAMASRHELLVATSDRAQADRAARAAIADVLRIEAKFTRYRDTSITSTINRNAGGDAVAIDAETVALLRDRRLTGASATAYVCRRYLCDAPTADPLTLDEQLERAARV